MHIHNFIKNGQNIPIISERKQRLMDEQTRKLLEECTIGCQMASDSLRQIREYIRDSGLAELVDSYTDRHEKMRQEADARLTESGCSPKEPGTASSAFAWFTTEMKLTFNDDNTQIAKLLIDGCSMGIKTLGERRNTLDRADKKASELAEKIIRTEEDFMKDLQKYL